MENQQSGKVEVQSHTIYVVVTRSRSVGLAFLLAILFGPPGLFYASIAGGIIMFIFAIFSFLVLPAISLSLVWVGCVVWAVTAAKDSNQKAIAGIVNQPKPADRTE